MTGEQTKIKKEMEAGEEVLSAAAMKIKKHYPDIDVSVHAPQELLMIPMDAILIEQVLINLIENAIKHNSVGADRPLVIRIVAEAEAVTVSNNLQLKVSGNPSTRVGLNYIRQQYLDLSGIPIGIRRTDTEYCVTLPLL